MEGELRILIVEDDIIDQRQMKRVLSQSNLLVNTTIVDSAKNAINVLTQEDYDCCFLDYLLPDSNGIDLVKKLREKGVKIPIVIVTSHTGDSGDLPDRAIKAGATNYITKSLITPEGITLIIRNSINMRKVENELEASKEEALKLAHVKQDFLANMSHEIRTPLNAIIGFSDLLHKTTLNEKQNNYLDAISISSKNLLVLINDILDVSKLEKGKLALERKAISIKKIIGDVVTLNSQAAKIKGLKLLSSIDHEIPEAVLGDATRLTQILINLISNAIKFTRNGNIKIEVIAEDVTNEDATLLFSVRDTGIGIPKEKIAHIFERFTQAESSTTREYGGTGLGLNIVKMLVDLHQGKINISSELGQGTEFSFKICYRIADSSELEITNEKENVKSQNLEGLKILVVEDNQLNQMLAESYITKNNGTVDIAENGIKAIERLKDNNYDCIMMDLQMPKLDGYQTTDLIRNNLKLETPIIACSAHFQEEEREKAKEVGMDDYITKPYSEELMIQLILNYTKNENVRIKATEEPEKSPTDDFEHILKTLEEKQGKTFISKLVYIYKNGISEAIDELKNGIENSDLKVLRAKAHFLTGSLSVLNLQYGHNLATQVENFAIENYTEETKALAAQLIHYLEISLVEIDKLDY
jgi:signal transduction histidine kinase/HPt (histidine-containing phosphotransfer) domain-containing protein